MRLNHNQKVAYHEAAHAVAAVQIGIPFEEIALTPDSEEHQGIMLRIWTPWNYQKPSDLQNLFITLAGPAANKHMHPGYNWGVIALTGAGKDYEQASQIAERAVGKAYASILVNSMTGGTVLTFVRERWKDIIKLGDALLTSEGLLKYDECREVLGMMPSWKEPMHPEVKAFFAAHGAEA